MAKVKLTNKINYQIEGKEVRIVGEANEQPIGVIPFEEAIQIAVNSGFDLIQVSAIGITPPVCRITEVSKFLYEQKQKEKDKKKKQKGGELKELWLSPNIGQNDLETKAKKAIEFLSDGNKVKVILEFKGRMNLYKDQGELVMIKFADIVKEYGLPEYMPKTESKRMHCSIKPIRNGTK